PHDRVHFAGADLEVDALQDFVVADSGLQALDLEHWYLQTIVNSRQSTVTETADPRVYPTLPSRPTFRSFCASTANSIGSSLKTALQKPFAIMETASSAEMPRCWK